MRAGKQRAAEQEWRERRAPRHLPPPKPLSWWQRLMRWLNSP